MLQFRQIEAFKAVMEAGTVTAAAERLGVSQPAISKLLAQIEDTLGFQLFERLRRRLVPTPDAAAFYRQVERAFVGLDELSHFLTQLRDLRQGRLVIGCFPSLSTVWVAGMVAGFVRQHPTVTVSVVARTSAELASLLANGQLDFAILRQVDDGTGNDRAIVRRMLFSNELVCIFPRGHRLTRLRLVRPADLEGQPFISLGRTDRARQQIDSAFDTAGVRRRLTLDSGTAATVCAMVAEGLGTALVDRFSAVHNRHLPIVARPFLPRIELAVWTAEPRDRPRSSLTRAFNTHLRQSVAALTETSAAS